MRARAFVPMFLFAVSLPALAGEEKKEDAIKVDMSYLEKTWGIKYKSYKVADDTAYRGAVEKKPGLKKTEEKKVEEKKVEKEVGEKGKRVTFLLEFTKDVENLEELREAFSPRSGGIRYPNQNAPLWFYFFDEDNVSVFKFPPDEIEGEVTGKKGDAFRASVRSISLKDFEKIRKIEARPGEDVNFRYEKKKGKP